MDQHINGHELNGKKVLVRVDFNVPLQDGVVQNTARIEEVVTTINFLKKAGAKIILMSHLGKTRSYTPEQSLKLVIPEASKILNSNIIFIDDPLQASAAKIIDEASYDDIILLENLRFHNEEEECCEDFAKKLASLADFYINEAFSVSHRKHASVYLVPKFLPHAFGFSFRKEVEAIDDFFSRDLKPKMAIVGGSKLSTKVKLLKNLVKKVDKLAFGGGIAGAFLAYFGSKTLKIFDPGEFEEDVKGIISNAEAYGCKLLMPIDFSALIANEEAFEHAIISDNNSQASVFDIGPRTVDIFLSELDTSAMVLWNGPVGLFEKPPFDYGTASLAKRIASLSDENKIFSIVGGGDTIFAANKFAGLEHFDYTSTSGGAFLAYLEGTPLPGITALCHPLILKE